MRPFAGNAPKEKGITMGTIKEINGTCTSAKIFTTKENDIDPYAAAQLQMLCDNEALAVKDA